MPSAAQASQSIRLAARNVWTGITGIDLSTGWIVQGAPNLEGLHGLYAWLISIKRSTTEEDLRPFEQNNGPVTALVEELKRARADVKRMREEKASKQYMADHILTAYSLPDLSRRTGFPIGIIRPQEQGLTAHVQRPARGMVAYDAPPSHDHRHHQHAPRPLLPSPHVVGQAPLPPELPRPVQHRHHPVQLPPPFPAFAGSNPFSPPSPRFASPEYRQHFPPPHQHHPLQPSTSNPGHLRLPRILPLEETQLPPIQLPPDMAKEEEEARHRGALGPYSLAKRPGEGLGYGAAWTARKAAIYGRRASGW